MSDLDFVEAPLPISLSELAARCNAEIPAGTDLARLFRPNWSIERAGRDDVAFVIGEDDQEELAATRAGACFVRPEDREHVPATTIALVTDDPLEAFRSLIVEFDREPRGARSIIDAAAISPLAVLHATARLEPEVSIEPYVVVGPSVEIGMGTSVGSHAVIGAGVRVGRGCRIGTHTTIRNSLIGDRVIVHDGAQVGTNAALFGAARGSERTQRRGRVIIQDDAEIGPNAIISRGLQRDTLVGDGTRIGARVLVEGGRTVDRRRVVGADPLSPPTKMS